MTAFAYLIEPPFNYRGPDGAVTGCDVELARYVFGRIGHEFELVEVEFAQLLPGLADKRWRMTTGLFATDERRQVAAFSHPIWALPDGLLVQAGNPLQLTGYRSAAAQAGCVLAVVKNQVQYDSAMAVGHAAERILVFDTYADAAKAVLDCRAHAFASVARAHRGFLELDPELKLEIVPVAAAEKPLAFGSFALNRSDYAFKRAVDDVLSAYLGSSEHHAMMKRFGFSDAEIDLVRQNGA